MASNESEKVKSAVSVDLFMNKLEHRLPEIRSRAAGSLASAVSLGLLPAGQLAARLRERLQLPGWPGRQQALELLQQLTPMGVEMSGGDGHSTSPPHGYSSADASAPHGDTAVGASSPEGYSGSPSQEYPSGPLKWNAEMSADVLDWTAEESTDIPDWTAEVSADVPDWTAEESTDIPHWTAEEYTDIPDWTAEVSADVPDWTAEESADIPDWTAEEPADVPDWTADQSAQSEHTIDQLPWMRLVSSDERLLAATAEALSGPEPADVRRALQFTCDLLLRDLPAEVFLQRPCLLQALFHVMASTPESETDLLLGCMEALTALTGQLVRRCDVIACVDSRPPSPLLPSVPDPPESEGAAAPLAVVCGQLLSQAVTSFYIRHWAALRSAARLADAVCQLARRCVTPTLWRSSGGAAHPARTTFVKALKVLGEVLRWHRQRYQRGDSARLHRTGWLLAAQLLADVWSVLAPPTAGWARRHGVLSALVQTVFDELLFAQQPRLHARLLTLCGDRGCRALWTRLLRARRAMHAARTLTHQLPEALVAAEVAELHGGAALAEKLADIACDVTAAESERQSESSVGGDGDADGATDHADREAACARLLLRLLTAPSETLRGAAYRRAAAAARAALAAGADSPRRSVVALLQPRVLQMALQSGLCHPQTGRDAADIVVYVVTAEAWTPALRPHLLLCLPLLLCHVARPRLSRPLNHVIHLAGTDSPQADLLLATHGSRRCRQDAWWRLLRRLTEQPGAEQLLPQPAALGRLQLADLLLLQRPPAVCSRRASTDDAVTLPALLALLPTTSGGSASLEVRRAALSQLTTLMEDSDLHRPFVEQDGLTRVTRLVTRAIMREPDLSHDVGLLPGCVQLLRQLVLLSPGCRRQLADDHQLQLLLLRVLLMFHRDERVRAPAAQLLVALALDQSLSCRRAAADGGAVWLVTVPQLMLDTLRLPFSATAAAEPRPYGRSGAELPPSVLTEPVTVSGERVSLAGLVRACWGLAWHGSLGPQSAQQPYSAELRLPDWQLAAAGAGQLPLAAAETLHQLHGVTSHTAARVLLAQLACYTRLHRAAAPTDHESPDPQPSEVGAESAEPSESVEPSEPSEPEPAGVLAASAAAADRWLAVLGRHLVTAPATEPDRRVLTGCLQLLLLQPPDAQLTARAVELLSGHTRLLTETLARAAIERRPSTDRSALTALQLLAELCQRRYAGGGALRAAVALCAVEVAERAGSERYYSLAVLQRCVSVLQVALQSGDDAPAAETAAAALPTLRLLRRLCVSLAPPADAAERSWVGAGVLSAATLCLHALTRQQVQWSAEWEAGWCAEDAPDGAQLLWLATLWHHHDAQIRWGAVAALLGLARWPEGATFITRQLQRAPGGVWQMALCVLVRGDETAAVREAAALLLAALAARLSAGGRRGRLQQAELELVGPQLTDSAAEVCVEGAPALVALLARADWCQQVCGLIDALPPPPVDVRPSPAAAGDAPAPDPCQTVCSSPGLAAAALRLTYNALVLSPADLTPQLPDVLHRLQRRGAALCAGLPATLCCWREAVRLCAAAVQLQTSDPDDDDGGGADAGARHLLLCDRRVLHAAAAAADREPTLRAGVFALLSALLAAAPQPAFSATAELLGRWPQLAAALGSAPALLQTLLAEQSARLLHLVPGRPLLSVLESVGAALCESLVASPAAGERRRCLSALLLVSPAAKQRALQLRLHSGSCRQLRRRVEQLVTGSLSLRAAASKQKERGLLAAVLEELELLRNLMSGCTAAKVALTSAGLADLLHKLWPWCAPGGAAGRRLAVAVLCTLNTLAAGCVDGARRLAYTSPAVHRPLSSAPSGRSLVHAVLEDCRRQLTAHPAAAAAVAGGSSGVQRLAVGFSLLAAAALVPEGRSIICRSTFVSQFGWERAAAAAGQPPRRRLAVTRLWLLLIKNLTFFDDGQRVVARIPEVADSLVALMTQDDAGLRSSALLVLRNLSYLSAMQTTLLGTEGFVSGVVAAVRADQPTARCAGVALCCQLLTHSRKTRALLTSGGHLRQLSLALQTIDGSADAETAPLLAQLRELLRENSAADRSGAEMVRL